MKASNKIDEIKANMSKKKIEGSSTLYVRDTCLSNEKIEANPPNQLDEFKHKYYYKHRLGIENPDAKDFNLAYKYKQHFKAKINSVLFNNNKERKVIEEINKKMVENSKEIKEKIDDIIKKDDKKTAIEINKIFNDIDNYNKNIKKNKNFKIIEIEIGADKSYRPIKIENIVSTISAGKLAATVGKEIKINDFFIKTILVNEISDLYDIAYNFKANILIPSNIAKVEKIIACDVVNDKNIKQISSKGFVVVAIEKMQSFKKKVYELYKKLDLEKFKTLFDKLTDSCDKLNNIGLYHTNLTYKNIGIRTLDKESYDVVLTDFVETVFMKTDLYYPPDNMGYCKPVDQIIPINSFYICVYVYKNLKKEYTTIDTSWLIYLLKKGSYYYQLMKKIVDFNIFLWYNTPPLKLVMNDLNIFFKFADLFAEPVAMAISPMKLNRNFFDFLSYQTVNYNPKLNLENCENPENNYDNKSNANSYVKSKKKNISYAIVDLIKEFENTNNDTAKKAFTAYGLDKTKECVPAYSTVRHETDKEYKQRIYLSIKEGKNTPVGY